MKEELTIEHVVPYLPHGLKVLGEKHLEKYGEHPILPLNGLSENKGWQYEFLHNDGDLSFVYINNKKYKLILRPLSDLTKEEWKEEVLMYFADLDIDIRVYNSGNDNKNDFTLSITYKLMGETFTTYLVQRGLTRETPRHFYEWLLQNHFDVDNLIEKGLAIDVNTLENNPYGK